MVQVQFYWNINTENLNNYKKKNNKIIITIISQYCKLINEKKNGSKVYKT